MDNPSPVYHIVQLVINGDQKLINSFCDFFEPKHFGKDSYFLKVEQPITKIGILTEGVLRIFTTDEAGKEVNISLVPEGRFVIGSFVPEKQSTVNIHCITEATMFVAEFNKLVSFLETNGKLKEFYENYLSRAHLGIQNQLTQYLRLDAKDRYLAFLEEYPNLINRIPHYHVANYLGISGTQLSRIRNGLAKKIFHHGDTEITEK